MNVNAAVVNTPDMNGQNDLYGNKGADMAPMMAGSAGEGNISQADQDDIVTITTSADKNSGKGVVGQTNSTNIVAAPDLFGAIGVIAVDSDKNVIVQFYDKTGKMVAQFPPDQYLAMMKHLNQVAASLFHVKA